MEDEQLHGLADDDRLTSAGLSKLRWRCRRGLLENDLFIERFFNHHADALTVGQARGMYSLMELADNDLLDVLLGRPHTQTVTKDPRVQSVLHLLKV
ncbi:MAG: succinate dehydrogenase assembly factor 2 [Betaproteobacteria bacterium]|jgi:antitoxin CptB|nr:succinate dehydrogenase assembly factor 2 [Betaproteobacteria bacterium]